MGGVRNKLHPLNPSGQRAEWNWDVPKVAPTSKLKCPMNAPDQTVQDVIAAIQSPSGQMSEALMMAALLLEKFCDTGDWRRFSHRVDAAEVNSESGARLRAALLSFVERHPDHEDVGAAIFALTRCVDDSLRPCFLRLMKRYHDAGHFHPMSQAEYGLTVLGDGVQYGYAPGQTDHTGYFQAVGEYLIRHSEELAD